MVEPYSSFNAAKIKTEWAEKHIPHLEMLEKSFVDANSQIALVNHNLERPSHLTLPDTPEIPDEITLIAGDIIRNLRGALDYCWTGLYRAAKGAQKKPPTIPFCDNTKGLKSMVSQSEVGARFPQAETLLVEKLRTHSDFADNGNRPLVILNRLSNWEKHNLLILAVKAFSLPTVTVGTNFFQNISAMNAHPTSLLFVSDNMEVKAHGNAAIKIVFGDHELVHGQPLVPTIRDLLQATTEAVNAFAETEFI